MEVNAMAIANLIKENEKLRKELADKTEALEQAVKLLREGKAMFTPNTTNSFVDDFLAKYPKSDESGVEL